MGVGGKAANRVKFNLNDGHTRGAITEGETRARASSPLMFSCQR